MATIRLPPDFKEFLKLLNSQRVEYLLVGGYAVGYHGYPRSTGDMDLWLARSDANAARVIQALAAFGFSESSLNPELFTTEHKVVRFGIPPLRIDLLTSVSGVEFQACYAQRITDLIDGIPVSVIGLEELKQNKRAGNRAKDLNDLEHLP